MSEHEAYMRRALALARRARGRANPNPTVGAVVVRGGRIVGEGVTSPVGGPHAEVNAFAKAGTHTRGATLYVTLEPCAMCAGVIAAARIRRLYYGASDPKSGGVEQGACVFEHPQSHHRPEVYAGVGETDARRLLTDFFAKLRKE